MGNSPSDSYSHYSRTGHPSIPMAQHRAAGCQLPAVSLPARLTRGAAFLPALGENLEHYSCSQAIKGPRCPQRSGTGARSTGEVTLRMLVTVGSALRMSPGLGWMLAFSADFKRGACSRSAVLGEICTEMRESERRGPLFPLLSKQCPLGLRSPTPFTKECHLHQAGQG